MKKFKYLIPVLALAVMCLVGCGKKDYDKFPEKYTLANVDVGGMTIKEAKKALKDAVKNYEVAVTLDNVEFTLKSADIGLKYNDEADMQALVNSANTGDKLEKKVEVLKTDKKENVEEDLVAAYVMAYQDAQAQQTSDGQTEGDQSEDTQAAAVAEQSLINPCKASIQYSQEAGAFVGVDGVEGDAPTYTKATEELIKIAKNLDKTAELESVIEHSQGEKAADSKEIQKALESANAYLALSLNVDFKPADGEEISETIPADVIANWLMVQLDGKSIELDSETMSAYCTELASKHDVTRSRKAKFKTTTEGYINISVKASGQTVDANQLYTDVYNALDKKESATINAVYSDVQMSDDDVMDFGGNYCEVDLTNQMVYVYKNGQQVVSSQCVTGCIAKGYGTPTGVYKIFSMDRDRYLNGPGYKTWVNFFMPFNGGIGFHDATWRSTFGGTIYLYNGSHGCINMPYSAVKTLYNNVSNGTYVIVHGGVSSVEGLSQAWSGNTYYSVTKGSSFKLDMTCLDNAAVTYESSNPGVASVDAAGNVTTGSAGTATITVNSAATGKYKASSIQITVDVKEPQAPSQPETPSQPQKQNPTITIGNAKTTATVGDAAFNLNASVNSGAGLSYKSDNNAVVTVDGSGNVTIVGAGTANITVSCGANGNYNAGSKTISIMVSPKPEPSQPETPDQPGNSESN